VPPLLDDAALATLAVDVADEPVDPPVAAEPVELAGGPLDELPVAPPTPTPLESRKHPIGAACIEANPNTTRMPARTVRGTRNKRCRGAAMTTSLTFFRLS
jgi:hypothetical protein